MATITIPKNLIKNDDLVVIPRKEYEEFLDLEKKIEKRLGEESDTDFAIKVYKEERRQGKLKIIKSLANSGSGRIDFINVGTHDIYK